MIMTICRAKSLDLENAFDLPLIDLWIGVTIETASESDSSLDSAGITRKHKIKKVLSKETIPLP